METVWAVIGGFVAGVSLWFPYKHVLNKMVQKKRETSAILQELGMSEKQHAEYPQQYNTTTWTDNTGGNMPYATRMPVRKYTWNEKPLSLKTWEALQSSYGSAQTGTSATSTTASTDLDCSFCTGCNALVGQEFGSCSHGTDAP